MKTSIMLCLLAAGCYESLDGTLRVHSLSESGDNVQYPKPLVTAILGPAPTDTLPSAPSDMMGGWTITTQAGTPTTIASGPMFLELGPYYDVTADRTIDLDYYTFGRNGLTFATSPTPALLQIDGLDPWASTDELDVFSLDAATGLFGVEQLSTMSPDAGATSAALDFDWISGQGVPVPGDHVYFAQLVQRANDGLTYSTVGKALASTTSVSYQGKTILTATLQDVPATTTFSLELAADEFAPLAAQVHPNASFQSAILHVVAKPGGTEIPFPLALGIPDVLLVDSQTNVAGTAIIGNPYPSTWSLVGLAQASFGVSYTAPGASSPATLSAIIEVNHLDTDARPYRPEIGPVQRPQIDHKNAFDDQINVGLTPLVTWEPPTLGRAAGGYEVTIWQIANNAGATTFVWTAQLETNGESVRIPPKVLALGSAYAFEIKALAAPHDIEQQPLQSPIVNAVSSVLTGTLLP